MILISNLLFFQIQEKRVFSLKIKYLPEIGNTAAVKFNFNSVVNQQH